MRNWTMKPAGWLLTAAVLLATAGCEWPPQETEQIGYRGTAMELVKSPETIAANADLHAVPAPQPPSSTDGPKARDIYQNVQVLGDLSVGEFTRLMLAITEWVSPEQGCNYCHVGENFADDSLYTKTVSRRMLQMNLDINGNWQDHVKQTGVTCYTCHRGQNVPGEIWFDQLPRESAAGFTADNGTQNIGGMASVAYSSLPGDPFDQFLDDYRQVRVIADSALPQKNNQGASIQATEYTYGLMMHMSTSLGVNCTFCHNSRAFAQWDQSTPRRLTSWHGVNLVRNLNAEYLVPLQPVYPEKRLGPKGDAPKANCATCHRGANKPLNGQSMLPDYPNLAP